MDNICFYFSVEPFWQWLVLTGAVVANALSGGITFSYGVTYTDAIDRLEVPATQAIIPAAIAFAAYCGVGKLKNPLLFYWLCHLL